MSRRSSRSSWLIAAGVLGLLLLALPFLGPAQTVRGKTGALPAATPPDQQQAQAQALALADPGVKTRLSSHRAEVLAVLPVGHQVTADSLACLVSPCRLVEIYDYDADATISAIVDLQAGLVLDVLFQPRAHPGANQRLIDLADDIARKSPEFTHELGRVPSISELSPMPSGVPGTPCAGGHLCLAVTAPQGQSLVWAVVDVTVGKLVAVLRTPIPSEAPGAGSSSPAAPAGCPSGGSVNRGGWSLSYETTPTDGFRVFDASYLGVPVLTSAKLAEVHVDYGTTGFVDEIGCSSYIFPYGATQIDDLLSGPDIVGFDMVQDFRQAGWGGFCQYRYEQHDEFYNDGRFRTVVKAFGQGCSNNGLYRPVMRLDLGLDGPAGDSFDVWDGHTWQPQATEGWWSQAAPYTPQGYKWRQTDQGGQTYFIEPGQGQFGDGGRGDFAFIYAVQHHSAEGDTDLPAIGDCCNSDYRQGPEQYINGESIAGKDIVLWYVPQMQAQADPGHYYCWTVSPSETYPCPAGPMFVPMPLAAGFLDNAPRPVAAGMAFTSTSGGIGPLTYTWHFGDGAGISSAANPVYTYSTPGLYTVTLNITDTTGSQSASRVVAVGDAPRAAFTEAASTAISNTLLMTNTTTGSGPLNYQWSFGDTITSTVESPGHTYAAPGFYTVVLTATNFIRSDSISRSVLVPPETTYWPIYVFK